MKSGNLGLEVTSRDLTSVLDHLFKTNLERESSSEDGVRPVPVCIWGSHGIGKTAIVKDFAESHGWNFKYIAPAQFEEMGDLHGLPVRYDPDPDIIGDEVTVYLPPDWVPGPDEVGPGILLLDDINRADDRILRGVMQLLQEFEMFSWKLPPKWQIVCTANPEGAEYSVTPMDDAMLTRMVHFTMVFEIDAWIDWALRDGIDERGIDFVRCYPETITGRRTTARSLTNFFRQIKDISNLEGNFELVNALAHGSLDRTTADAFLKYVTEDMAVLLSARDILDAKDARQWESRLAELVNDGNAIRVDRLSLVVDRVVKETESRFGAFSDINWQNLRDFIVSDSLVSDLRISLHKRLLAIDSKVEKSIATPEVSEKVIAELQ